MIVRDCTRRLFHFGRALNGGASRAENSALPRQVQAPIDRDKPGKTANLVERVMSKKPEL